MITQSIYLINAFTSRIFHGNPAAVMPLPAESDWPSDALLQQIAAENAVPETAFFRFQNVDQYELRWFTPDIEMDLCGHATLATAHVLTRHLNSAPAAGQSIRFSTKSGELRVTVTGDIYELDLPARPPVPAELPAEVLAAFPPPLTVGRARDYVLEYATEAEIHALRPNRAILDRINVDPGGIICTAPGAPGSGVDFVSRFFTPQSTIFEDPVTGSAHCTLVPFWAEKLGRTTLEARQVSARGGELGCTLVRLPGSGASPDRVHLRGQAVTYLQGEIPSLTQ